MQMASGCLLACIHTLHNQTELGRRYWDERKPCTWSVVCMYVCISLVPRPYFYLLLSLFIHKSHSEAAKKEMGVQLRKRKVGSARIFMNVGDM